MSSKFVVRRLTQGMVLSFLSLLISACPAINSTGASKKIRGQGPLEIRNGYNAEMVKKDTPSLPLLSNHSMLAYKGKMWIMSRGGYVWSSDDGIKWTREGEKVPWSVYGGGGHSAVVHNGRMWFISSLNETMGTSSYKDVERGAWSSDDGKTWRKELDNTPWSTRDGHTSVVHNGRIWVMGGNKLMVTGVASWPQVQNDVWSSKDGKAWAQLQSEAPWSARHGHTSVVHNGRIWVMGGSANDSRYKDSKWGVYRNGWRDENDVWSSKDGIEWAKMPDAPWSARHGHTSVVHDGKIWVMGGSSGGNDVWSSDDGKAWTQMPDAPWPGRYGHASVVYEDKIWVTGGQNKKNDVWSSSDGINWEQSEEEMWSGRAGHSSVSFDNKIWIMGGSIRGGFKNDVWSSSDGESWRLVTESAPWSIRYNHTSVVHKGKIWIIGSSGTGDVWNSKDGENWSLVTKNAPWTRRRGHSSVVHNGKIWVMGGNRGDHYLEVGGRTYWPQAQNDVWSSEDGIKWTEVIGDAPWPDRLYHSSAVHNGKIWMMGGMMGGYNNSDNKNDVWSSENGVNWTEMTAPNPWPSRRGHSTLAYKGEIWVIGGDDNTDGHMGWFFFRGNAGSNKKDAWSSSDGENWDSVAVNAPWLDRTSHSSVVHNGKIWILGGMSSNGNTYYNDVYSIEKKDGEESPKA